MINFGKPIRPIKDEGLDKSGYSNANLIKMIPFLEDEQLEELAEKIEDNNGEYKGLRLEVLLPFLDDTYVDQLFLNRLEKGKDACSFAPFVSDDIFNEMVKGCIDGRISVNLTKYLPFMDDETINLLMEKVSDGNEFCGVKMSSLMPFMDDDVIDNLLLERIHSGQDYMFMLPFASYEILSRIVKEYVEEKLHIDINPFLPFLEDEDIKTLFKYEMNKKG